MERTVLREALDLNVGSVQVVKDHSLIGLVLLSIVPGVYSLVNLRVSVGGERWVKQVGPDVAPDLCWDASGDRCP